MEYRAADGSLVASYAYDAFGRTIAQSGSLADTFRHRHATKFFEPETGFYYYGYRHYVPSLARWLTTDPIEEDGGLNLYAFCANNALSRWDAQGQNFGSCYDDCLSHWRGVWADLARNWTLYLSGFDYIPKSAAEIAKGSAIGKVSKNTTAWSRVVQLAKLIVKKCHHLVHPLLRK